MIQWIKSFFKAKNPDILEDRIEKSVVEEPHEPWTVYLVDGKEITCNIQMKSVKNFRNQVDSFYGETSVIPFKNILYMDKGKVEDGEDVQQPT